MPKAWEPTTRSRHMANLWNQTYGEDYYWDPESEYPGADTGGASGPGQPYFDYWGDWHRETWEPYQEQNKDAISSGIAPQPWIPDMPEGAEETGTEILYDEDPASPTYGLPVARGYYDEAGNWVQTRDLSGIAQSLSEARDVEFPGFQEWASQEGVQLTDVQASDPYQELMRLAGELESGPTGGELQTGLDYGQDYAAQVTGLGDEYTQILGDMATDLSAGVGAQPGMAPEQRQVYERAVQAQIEQQEQMATRTLNAMVVNGSTAMNLYSKSDEYMRQIRDTRIQGAVAIVDEDFQRQMANFESKKAFYDQLVQTGQIGSAQYMEMLQQGKAQAMTGYATGISTVLAQNQEYFQMYQADFNALASGVQNQYNAIQAELGVDMAFAEQIQADLDLFYYDYNKQLERYALELGAWDIQVQAQLAADAEDDSGIWGTIFGGIAIVAGILIAGPGGGAAVGAALVTAGAGSMFA